MMRLPVLAGSLPGEFAELADEIADVFKSAVQTDLQDTPGGFQKGFPGPVDTVPDEILNGRYPGDLSEKMTEILRVHLYL